MSLYNKITDLQKLQNAWKDVYKNKPKEGVDGVTYEEFEADRDRNIKQLWNELVNHSYECLPVQIVPIYKGEKVRYISLYSMRDKVVQNSVARELTQLYEGEISKCCYAYRKGKSALQAAQVIEKNISDPENNFVLRADIHSFFDCILHDIMTRKIREKIKEEDVVQLIMAIIKTPSLEKNGELKKKDRGIYQGSAIAPVLSNVYMMDFDKRLEQNVRFYLRYSDDLLLFFKEYNDAIAYKKQLSLYLEEIGLTLNEKKTYVGSIEDGFEFLGYKFDGNGISIPDKASDTLRERLEQVWMSKDYHSVKERLEKGIEIINGWEQYFSGKRVTGSIFEYAVQVYRMEKKGHLDLDMMISERKRFENSFKDIALFLADIWKKNNMPMRALMEYEEYYGLSGKDGEEEWEEENPLIQELLDIFSKFVVGESDDLRTELIQTYSDLKMYQKAEALSETYIKRADIPLLRTTDLTLSADTEISLNADEMAKYQELFVGREDLYAVNIISEQGKRKCEEVLLPLQSNVIKMHLQGQETVSTFVQRNNGTVKYLVIDVDISKGILLQITKEDMMMEYMKKCLNASLEVLKQLNHLGLEGYLEWSGYRGYHIWMFLSEWVPVRYINFLEDIIMQRTAGLWENGELQVEFFPNKTRLRNGKKGQSLKLPWGIHPKTGHRSYFVGIDGIPYDPQKNILKDTVQFSGNAIRRIVSANRMEEQVRDSRLTAVDSDLSEFGTLNDSVHTVLSSCNLLRYLCQKARKTHYLNHFERLTILYVFGHMGEEGKGFIHKVMSFTLNYSYQITQKFILRCPEKPISCLKLREQYKQISAEIGCSCNFYRTKNCYPSPVLHALKNSDENSDITIPLSRTMPAAKENVLKNEINIGSRVQEIAEKMMELRKQKRNLEKSIRKCEQELGEIFDDRNTDSIEIKMGLLSRRNSNGETEWVIEL